MHIKNSSIMLKLKGQDKTVAGPQWKQGATDKSADQWKQDTIDKGAHVIFWICAVMTVIAVITIVGYIFIEGVPAIIQIGVGNFIFGKRWDPSAEVYGIMPMIVGSLYATFGAVIIGIPVGVLTAVMLAELLPNKIAEVLNRAIEILAGIPSVVYGFWGLTVIVPLIYKYLGGKGAGNSLLAASIILGIMILPTVISISQTSLRALPKEYKEGSLALGASRIQTIFRVQIPAAKSGILAGIVLGIGRAIGETMAVILVAGNAAFLPTSVTDPIRTMTANIAVEMGYATGLHQKALFATGVILVIFIIIIQLTMYQITRKRDA